MTKTNSEILDQLRTAANGLLMMSESEYPVEVFLWEGVAPVTPQKVVQHTNNPQDTPIKIVGFDDFFQVSTTPEDWHGEEEKATINKFQALVQTLKENLSNLQVYRLGIKGFAKTAKRPCNNIKFFSKTYQFSAIIF